MSLQSIKCTGTDNLTPKTRENMQDTNNTGKDTNWPNALL